MQITHRGLSCAGILTSSKQSLCHIILSAQSWTRDTYMALQQIPHLEALLVKLYLLCDMQARELAKLRAKRMLLDFRCCNHAGLANLSLARPTAHIHELTLWGVNDNCCSSLRLIPFLKTLNVVNSADLTGIMRNLGM